MDAVVHFEITADDMKRAQKFYGDVFGWKGEKDEVAEYVMLTTTPSDPKNMNRPKEPGAINGGMMVRTGKIKSPVITIAVDDLDEALKRIEKAGGKVVVGKTNVADYGFSAYFQDSEGNVLGLWQAKMK